MKIWTEQEEADALRKRFAALKKEKKSRPEFAKEFEVQGGDSMIYQHMTCRRPISMEAARAYARGFKCSLDEISPRLAEDAKKSADLLLSTNTNGLKIEAESVPEGKHPAGIKVRNFPDRRHDDHPAITEVVKLMLEMSDEGRWMLAGQAKQMLIDRPKANPESSSQ